MMQKAAALWLRNCEQKTACSLALRSPPCFQHPVQALVLSDDQRWFKLILFIWPGHALGCMHNLLLPLSGGYANKK